MTALLTRKDRQLHPRGQVAKLVRIGKRATMKADWLEWEAPRAPGHVLSASDRAEITRWRARAAAAADEICRVVVENPDVEWTLPQRRAAETWQRAQ